MFLHVMMIFRKGMCINNQEYVYAGKNKLALLFFGRNDLHYHQPISQEKRVEALMPNEILKVKNPSLLQSRTGRLGYYQSGDAMIEEATNKPTESVLSVFQTIQRGNLRLEI